MLKLKLIACAIVLLLSGCGTITEAKSYNNEGIENPVSDPATIENIRLPRAEKILVESDGLVEVDYSNNTQGYIQVKTLDDQHNRIKVQIAKEEEIYNYDINKDFEYETFPLNMEDGTYEIRVFENITEDRYALLFEISIDVVLENQLLPYLYPNQISNYTQDSAAVLKSFELTEGLTTELERVQTIYDYIVNTIDYDWDKVDEVQGVYVLPVVDKTLLEQKGICFDYAALMTTMLRVQNIPTKLRTGNVEEGYHAWVEVYISNIGWIAPHIYFENETWTLIDPTFDSIDGYDGAYENKYSY